jgi:hypothetical protein
MVLQLFTVCDLPFSIIFAMRYADLLPLWFFSVAANLIKIRFWQTVLCDLATEKNTRKN